MQRGYQLGHETERPLAVLYRESVMLALGRMEETGGEPDLATAGLHKPGKQRPWAMTQSCECEWENALGTFNSRLHFLTWPL